MYPFFLWEVLGSFRLKHYNGWPSTKHEVFVGVESKINKMI